MNYEYKIDIETFIPPKRMDSVINTNDASKMIYTNAFLLEIHIPPEKYNEMFKVKNIKSVNKVLLARKIKEGLKEISKKGSLLPREIIFELKQMIKYNKNVVGEQAISKGKIEIYVPPVKVEEE